MRKKMESKARSLLLTGLEYFCALVMFSVLVFVVIATYTAIK